MGTESGNSKTDSKTPWRQVKNILRSVRDDRPWPLHRFPYSSCNKDFDYSHSISTRCSGKTSHDISHWTSFYEGLEYHCARCAECISYLVTNNGNLKEIKLRRELDVFSALKVIHAGSKIKYSTNEGKAAPDIMTIPRCYQSTQHGNQRSIPFPCQNTSHGALFYPHQSQPSYSCSLPHSPHSRAVRS